MKSKNQALVEYRDILDAKNFILNFTQYHPTIRGIVVYPSYSQHQELRQSQSSNNHSGNTHHKEDNTPPSRILLISILNPLYPINVDVLGQIFHSYDCLI
jgi:polypyrimidine tract-binding protein 2